MKYLSISLLLLCVWQPCISQHLPPFYTDIREFKKQDSIAVTPKNAILFVGSSSFTNWKDVSGYFTGYTIINRGFGGSTLPDLIRYSGEIILPYKPRQVVIYCGENDLAQSDTVSAQTVISRFRQLFNIIRSGLPKAKVTFISLKPSPSRWKLSPAMIVVNEGIQSLLRTHPNTSFVDVYSRMIDKEGNVRTELFVEDKLHMNGKGYTIWQEAIKPHLLNE